LSFGGCSERFANATSYARRTWFNAAIRPVQAKYLLDKYHRVRQAIPESTCARLIGFNISERQVRYANERAKLEHLADKLSFRLGVVS
jgi:hypothetical protein